MTALIESYSYWVALGAAFLQCLTVYLFVEYFFLTEKYLSPYVARFGLWMVCAVGIVSATLSLTYSEFFGFIPCGLCWIQRGFLYAITIISSIALGKTFWGNRTNILDTSIADYGIGLSGIAAVIAFYHHYVQMGGSVLVVCPTAGIGADCARRLVFEFGYMTFPLMSFSVFAFFIAVFLTYRKAHR